MLPVQQIKKFRNKLVVQVGRVNKKSHQWNKTDTAVRLINRNNKRKAEETKELAHNKDATEKLRN